MKEFVDACHWLCDNFAHLNDNARQYNHPYKTTISSSVIWLEGSQDGNNKGIQVRLYNAMLRAPVRFELCINNETKYVAMRLTIYNKRNEYFSRSTFARGWKKVTEAQRKALLLTIRKRSREMIKLYGMPKRNEQ